MCDNLTYRSAGAETLVRMDTINILLRWSKEGVLGYVGTVFVQLNSPDEPISYIRTHVILTKNKKCINNSKCHYSFQYFCVFYHSR